MRRKSVVQMRPICADGTEVCGTHAHSEKAQLSFADELPDFVRRAIDLGYDPEESWDLFRRIVATRKDVNARRITPAAGVRRVDRLALAVAIAKAAGVAS